MDKLYDKSETGCCLRFDPKPWDGKTVEWKDKLFLKDRTRSLFHIPLNFGSVIVRNMERIKAAGALAPKPLMLCDDGMFGSDLYIAVSKDVPGAKMERISGTFLSKVFEGPYKNAGKWAKEMHAYVASKGNAVKKLYFFYTTCPRCAKAYGKNYTVILAQV